MIGLEQKRQNSVALFEIPPKAAQAAYSVNIVSTYVSQEPQNSSSFINLGQKLAGITISWQTGKKKNPLKNSPQINVKSGLVRPVKQDCCCCCCFFLTKQKQNSLQVVLLTSLKNNEVPMHHVINAHLSFHFH